MRFSRCTSVLGGTSLRVGADGSTRPCAGGAGNDESIFEALPGEVERCSLTSLRERVVKIGAKVIAHRRHLIFQMAEVAVPHELFGRTLARKLGLRPPDPAPC